MWNRWRDAASGAAAFEAGKPWLLRFFDQIRFYPVSEQELVQIRRDFPAGRYPLRIEDGQFAMRDYSRFLDTNADSIAAFKKTQRAAFDAERERWRETGQAEYVDEPETTTAPLDASALPDGARTVCSQVPGSVWKVAVAEGETVAEGATLVIVESMKMEFAVTSPCAGKVWRVFCTEGGAVGAGQEIVVVQPLVNA